MLSNGMRKNVHTLDSPKAFKNPSRLIKKHIVIKLKITKSKTLASATLVLHDEFSCNYLRVLTAKNNKKKNVFLKRFPLR